MFSSLNFARAVSTPLLSPTCPRSPHRPLIYLQEHTDCIMIGRAGADGRELALIRRAAVSKTEQAWCSLCDVRSSGRPLHLKKALGRKGCAALAIASAGLDTIGSSKNAESVSVVMSALCRTRLIVERLRETRSARLRRWRCLSALQLVSKLLSCRLSTGLTEPATQLTFKSLRQLHEVIVLN
ncbi:unnamed protein product [Cercospora beticola]|nr:unnamed protein product [Cercospora beticola]